MDKGFRYFTREHIEYEPVRQKNKNDLCKVHIYNILYKTCKIDKYEKVFYNLFATNSFATIVCPCRRKVTTTSTLNSVTVYRAGAEMNHTANAYLKQGIQS